MTFLRAGGQLRRPLGVAAVTAATMLALGRASVGAQGPSPTAGRQLFEQACAWCHGADGQGTANGPSLIGVGAASADFMLRTGRMPIPQVVRQPRRSAPTLDPSQIAALDQFVASLGPGPPIPTVEPASGDLGEGARLYQDDCAACHSSTGIGGALTNGLQAPGLMESTPTEVVEAVRLGGAGLRTGHMPKFGSDVLSDQQLDSVVRYVLYLQRPRDPGGFDLGHIGPVAEGFAAWAGVLLILVLVVRWIGTRSPP